jgi:RES domain-containing protein
VRLWRISDFDDLSGQGALLRSARWHSVARPLVYLADHPASALLEVLVHMEVDDGDWPNSYQLLAVDIPDGTEFDDAPALSTDWRANPDETHQIGNRWLAEARTALLRVPSVIVPYTWNWLLNPHHTDAKLARIAEVVRATFDPRLFD